MPRDYSIIGPAPALSNPSWYRTKVDPASIRALMVKDDRRAGRDAVLWLGLMVVFAGLGIALWPSWWSTPFWLAYGVLYGSGADARWHECGHKTAFETAWKNEVIYQIASFMLMRNPVVWRASHVRHHTDTVIVGRDPEIVAMRPPDLLRILINLFGLVNLWVFGQRMFLHATGHLHPEEEPLVREQDRPRVFRVTRIWLAIYALVGLACLSFGTILPLMVIGLPMLYGAWHHILTGLLQHLGLAENVTDHRLNTRTVLMNSLSQFIYLNMNYHLEHHMFTMVPYYNLPALHELIKHDTPAPDPSMIAAFRRLLPVLLRQLRYENAVIIPDLPPSATPYGAEVELLKEHAYR
ncbi:fatty acid desaturase [Cognatiyoonia sp.]|uniref:fatty acid desaturase n=1 Tax=Cognatiyoonia sp. TaxID=2211652 RepID=UPI003F6A324A